MKGLERYLSVLYQKFAAYCDTLIVNERIDELGLENDTNLILLSLYEVYIMIQREQIPIDKQLYQNVYIYEITIDWIDWNIHQSSYYCTEYYTSIS